MAAAVVQAVEHRAGDEWCAICLECPAIGVPSTDKDAVMRQALAHNAAHHDGAHAAMINSAHDVLRTERFMRRHAYFSLGILAFWYVLAGVFRLADNPLWLDAVNFVCFAIGVATSVTNFRRWGRWQERMRIFSEDA